MIAIVVNIENIAEITLKLEITPLNLDNLPLTFSSLKSLSFLIIKKLTSLE